jgi:hypothetical protein
MINSTCQFDSVVPRRVFSDQTRSTIGLLSQPGMRHYRDYLVDVNRLRVDPSRAIARVGADTCATIRERFEMPTPSLVEFETLHRNIQHTVRYTELAPGRFKR